ncbi:MAG: terminase large subunit [Bacteroidales bacterium]|nr:terminase large subunit [Bacteroidales bacterium]
MSKTYDIVEQYAQDVLQGRIVRGQSLVDACERYYRDKKEALDKGFYLDIKAGEMPVNFIQSLKHTKGVWAGRPLLIEPWQTFLLFNLFGWKRADGRRRFRTAYIEVARKNGKTALAAGIALYGLFAEQLARAEVYSVATTRDQAKLCFNDAQAIVKATALSKRLKVWRDSISYEKTGSFFKALSADYGVHDGSSPSTVIVDEFHAHPNTGMLDVMRSGQGARENPMNFIITTAGFNKNYPCYAFRNNAKNVMKGVTTDDTLFVMIFEMDEGDDWLDPKNWAKANPNLGVSVDIDWLAEQVQDAQNRPEAVVNVKTKNLNMWVDAEDTWILDNKWMESSVEEDDSMLQGMDCWGGLDLSNVSDITAFVLIFKDDEGRLYLKPYFWIPEDTLKDKIAKENVFYAEWVQKGYVKVTPGNVVDYDYIRADIDKIADEYNVMSIAYDRWNSSQMVINMQSDGFTMSPFGQGYGSMSAPTKEFEKMVLQGKVEHFGNPVLRWMMSSVAIQRDPAGNIKPDKRKSSQKIDGVVASIMALGEMMTAMADEDSNPYNSRGLRSL